MNWDFVDTSSDKTTFEWFDKTIERNAMGVPFKKYSKPIIQRVKNYYKIKIHVGHHELTTTRGSIDETIMCCRKWQAFTEFRNSEKFGGEIFTMLNDIKYLRMEFDGNNKSTMNIFKGDRSFTEIQNVKSYEMHKYEDGNMYVVVHTDDEEIFMFGYNIYRYDTSKNYEILLTQKLDCDIGSHGKKLIFIEKFGDIAEKLTAFNYKKMRFVNDDSIYYHPMKFELSIKFLTS